MSASDELQTLKDLVRYGASRFNKAGLCFGHSVDNGLDEALQLVLHVLALPHDLPPAYGDCRLTSKEKREILKLFERRIDERVPVAYLTGNTRFAELSFKTDARALVPRSPIAELIQNDFAPYLDERVVYRALDLCCGGGSIGLAMAHYQPNWWVDLVDVSTDALALAAENRTALGLAHNTELIQSNLFAALGERQYDLIVSNPPYVTEDEYAALPAEYAFEPKLGLTAGADGLDIVLEMLSVAPDFLTESGLMIVEVGESERALQALLPEVYLEWIEFKVGEMGVFVIERHEMVRHRKRLKQLAKARKRPK
jgi:ribosomal protein L3 glutamine methyltransferase